MGFDIKVNAQSFQIIIFEFEFLVYFLEYQKENVNIFFFKLNVLRKLTVTGSSKHNVSVVSAFELYEEMQ